MFTVTQQFFACEAQSDYVMSLFRQLRTKLFLGEHKVAHVEINGVLVVLQKDEYIHTWLAYESLEHAMVRMGPIAPYDIQRTLEAYLQARSVIFQMAARAQFAVEVHAMDRRIYEQTGQLEEVRHGIVDWPMQAWGAAIAPAAHMQCMQWKGVHVAALLQARDVRTRQYCQVSMYVPDRLDISDSGLVLGLYPADLDDWQAHGLHHAGHPASHTGMTLCEVPLRIATDTGRLQWCDMVDIQSTHAGQAEDG